MHSKGIPSFFVNMMDPSKDCTYATSLHNSTLDLLAKPTEAKFEKHESLARFHYG